MTLDRSGDGDAIEIVEDGVTLLRYRPDTAASKPFAGTVALPPGAGEFAGRDLVLAGPHDHPWHLGLFFCQKLIDGINCWESEPAAAAGHLHGHALDRGHETRQTEGAVTVEHQVAWETNEGEALLGEDRSVTVHAPGTVGPDDGYLIEWETTLRARGHERRLGSESLHGHYSGLSARLARDLDGGRILLPEGEYDGEGARGSDAPWCDYSGPLDGRVGSLEAPTAGLAFLDHPENAPGSRWFTMTGEFGFVAANPTWGEVLTLDPGDPRSFRWGIWVHAGTPDRSAVQRVHDAFVEDT
jgi:hypothetical protein